MSIKKLVLVSLMLTASITSAIATEEIDVIVAGGPGGMTNATTQIVNGQLRKQGYKTNVIIGGNCKNGGVLYNKENSKPTLLFTSLDYMVLAEASGDCVVVPKTDFIAVLAQSHHLICGPAGSTLEKFVAEKNEIIMSSETGSTAKAVVAVVGQHSGVKIKHIMYESSGAAVKGLLSGEVQYAATWPDKIVDHVQSGKVSCFATAANHEVLGAKPITKIWPTAKIDGAISYIVMIGKNISSKAEFENALNLAFKSPEWDVYMSRTVSVIPAINGNNHLNIFKDAFIKNTDLYNKNRAK